MVSGCKTGVVLCGVHMDMCGVHRDGDLIIHDNDVDLCVLLESPSEMAVLYNRLKDALPYSVSLASPSEDRSINWIRVWCPLGFVDVYGAYDRYCTSSATLFLLAEKIYCCFSSLLVRKVVSFLREGKEKVGVCGHMRVVDEVRSIVVKHPQESG